VSQRSKLSVLWASPGTADNCAIVGEESGSRIRSSRTRSPSVPPPLVCIVTKNAGRARDKSPELPFLLDSGYGINERKRATVYKLISEDKIYIFFLLALQPPLGVVFYSPLVGFSLLAYEVS